MDRKKLEKFGEILREKRRNIAGEVENLRKAGLAQTGDGPMDTADEASSSYEKLVSLGVGEAERIIIKSIDEALERIKTGEYGLCVECGGKISEARLKALPYADKCVECKSEEESRGR